MIRRALCLLPLLLCAACATTQTRVAPVARIPDAPPRGEPTQYANMPAVALKAAFGRPAFVRKDGAIEMWRYDGEACRAFFFLYGAGTAQAVRHVETLPHGVTQAADSACLTALRTAPPRFRKMLRKILGTLAGLVAWAVLVTVLNFGLRAGLTGYAAVEKAMTFTLVMMIARLFISAVSSLASGWIAARVEGRFSALCSGLVLLLLFLPVHYQLFAVFPLWYHLIFLASLPLLSVIGGRLARP